MQLKNHLNHIKAEDRALARDLDQLDTMSNSHLTSIARQRGITLETEEHIRKYMREFWLPLSVEADLSGDLLVWISFMRFSYCQIMV